MQNLSSHSLEQLYRKCLDAVSQISGTDSEKSTEKYLQEMGFFNKDTTYLNAVYGIMDMSNLSFKYIANTEISLGIPEEAFIQKGLSQYLGSMAPNKDNLASIPVLFKFMFDSIQEAPKAIRQNFIGYGFGTKHIRPSGSPFHTMVQLFGLEFNNDGTPSLCFFVDQDVEHLVKDSENYVGRMSFNNGEYVTTFSSKEMLLKKHDIFTDREHDVLKYLLKGYESKQIGEKLFISSNTVDNHRKNMIRKVDARDTTALIQISKQLGILK
jgi:DNA-binding CsgD family transcriptional regulator